MRIATLIVGFVMSVLVAGCQSPTQQQATSTSSSPASIPYQPFGDTSHQSRFFPAEMKAASASFGQQLYLRCSQSGQSSAFESCFRAQMVDAFDVPSIGKEVCGNVANIEKYGECLGLGTLANRLQHKITPQHRPEMTADDWRAPNEYLKTLTKGLILDIVDTCLGGDSANMEHCARSQFEHMTEIPDQLAATCEAKTDSTEYGSCIGEAMAVQMLQHAADRLGAKSANLGRQPAPEIAQSAL